ncbi:TonB-dependent siderophore receptor [Alkalimarinus coralli]|uniref:TonB-dependent siderophore receptor n=1 Tax=Alkalimarinus coralli TaxID=2935863 RepID=UPI00202B9ABA|nr:TonB-dependent siderophore receptor [Alkalimarinus coralli]
MGLQKNKLATVIAMALSTSFSGGVVAENVEDKVAESNEVQDVDALEAITVSGEGSAASEYIATDSSRFNKLDAPIAETPRSVSVVTRKSIEDRGAQSIQDSLGYTSGVLAGPFGFDSRLDSTRIRGVSPLDFHDGFRSKYGFYNSPRPDIYTLESVEVIKGPSSVLYGQGALGGIVNSTSKLPQQETKREVDLQYGTFDRKQVGIDFTGKVNDSGTFLYRLVGVARDSDTQVDHVEDDAKVFMPSLTWQPDAETSLTLLANIQENEGGSTLQFLPNEGTLTPGRHIGSETFIGEPGWDRYDTKQQAYSLFFDRKINDIFSLSVNGRYTDSEADYKTHWITYVPWEVINPDGTVLRTIYDAPATTEVFTGNAILKADFSTGALSHNASFGTDYIKSTTDTDKYTGRGAGGLINIYNPIYGNVAATPQPVDTPADQLRQLGFFVGDQIRYGNWIASLGVRQDAVKQSAKDEPSSAGIDETVTTYDAGLMYQFANGISPYYSYAESFEPLGKDMLGSQLKPKEGVQHEVGIKYQPVDSSALYTVAAFHIDETNRPTSGGPGITVQTGKVSIRGVELEAQKRLNDFQVLANYSYIDAQNRDGEKSVRVAAVAPQQASAWVSYDPVASGVQAGIGARYVGKSWDGTDTLYADPYTLVDAMIGYDFGDVLVSLNGKNIADKEFVATTDSGRSFYGERRTVVLSTKLRF